MNYTKFVILAERRTGSNLLQLLLLSHDNVLCFGEIFNRSEKIRNQIRRIERPITYEDDPLNYLERYIFKEHSDQVLAVGFRLFYYQARNPEWNAVWDYLRKLKIKIIHLKRKNLLDRYLSNQLAARSQEWLNKGGPNRPQDPIILNSQHCFDDFHRSRKNQKQAADFFQNNPVLDIFYESLCSDLPGESGKILEFLGLKFQTLSSESIKQREKKKSEIIANYEDFKRQLMQKLSSSKDWPKEEWIGFFTE